MVKILSSLNVVLKFVPDRAFRPEIHELMRKTGKKIIPCAPSDMVCRVFFREIFIFLQRLRKFHQAQEVCRHFGGDGARHGQRRDVVF